MALATLKKLSATATRLLRGHKPGHPAYLSWALGPPRSESALIAIDAAYAELVPTPPHPYYWLARLL